MLYITVFTYKKGGSRHNLSQNSELPNYPLDACHILVLG